MGVARMLCVSLHLDLNTSNTKRKCKYKTNMPYTNKKENPHIKYRATLFDVSSENTHVTKGCVFPVGQLYPPLHRTVAF
jgi:hypothetical protein